MRKIKVQVKVGDSVGEFEIEKGCDFIILDLNEMAANRGYKLVPIPPEPDEHIILGEN